MKTLKQMKKEHNGSVLDLIIGLEQHWKHLSAKDQQQELENVIEGGADCGISEFIYFHETCKFYVDNKDAILRIADDFAEELGTTLLGLIRSFRGLRDIMDEENMTDLQIMSALQNNSDADNEHLETVIQNAMAWFALEHIAGLADV